jgi:SAM-dependent methyltransferase
VTPFELAYAFLRGLEHPLPQYVHRTIKRIAKDQPARPRLLDIGGRRSNYTIGVPAEVCITDVPRERAIQHELDLGATDELREGLLRKRSNVKEYLYDDMTETRLPESSFDMATAIEVLEHVDADERFVANVHRVLRPGGTFLMTTPNGDFKPTPYPDHKRHYRRADLESLLGRYFTEIRTEYRVNAGPLFRFAATRTPNRHPLRSALNSLAYGASALVEWLGGGGGGPARKHHLVAICRKAAE